MADNNKTESAGMQLANEIIDMTNTRLAGGADADDLASGLRHAAANFSAFAFFRSEAQPKDPNPTIDAFVSFFEHYLDVHKPSQQAAPGQNLKSLVEQAKNEL